MTKRSLFAVALVVAAAAALECKRANGAYCDDSRPCPSGFACDLTARECHGVTVGGDMAGVSTDMAGCTCSGPTPICVAMTCVSCLSSSDPEGACAAASPSTPHCQTSDGTCVACRDASDCSGTTPFCDASTHVCRGCVADAECPSLICDLTPSTPAPRQCIPIAQVVYVDPNGDDGPGQGLTPTTPNKTIQHAINNAVGLTPVRGFVHAATGTYAEGGTGVNNKTIYIVGADGATVHATMGGKDGLGAGGGGSLTVRNMTVIADMGNGGNCNGSSFAAYRTKFINSGQTGVVSVGCAPLILDGCIVSGNKAGGVVVQSGDFTIVNSVLASNSGGAGMYQTGGGTTTVFVNNTIADNTTGGGVGGMHCASPTTPLPVNTILFNNKSAGSILSETDCMGSFLGSDQMVGGSAPTVDLSAQSPGFVGGGDYHLVAGSPCLDAGSSTVGPPPNHDADFLPRPDAKTMKIDLGAYELQQ